MGLNFALAPTRIPTEGTISSIELSLTTLTKINAIVPPLISPEARGELSVIYVQSRTPFSILLVKATSLWY